MKKSKFSEAQIVGILKEVELGAKVDATCRKHGISVATYYQWKSKFVGMDVSTLSQFRELQVENAPRWPVKFPHPWPLQIPPPR